MNAKWIPVSDTPDYTCGDLIAIYHKTVRGQAQYFIFHKTTPLTKRTLKNALSVGGLPTEIHGYSAK